MTTTQATATLVRPLTGFRGDARLYRLDPPLSYESDYDYAEDTSIVAAYEYVVVSGVDAWGKPETYIFGSDETGEVRNWIEAPGSFQGGIDHTRALEGAGYELAP